MLERVRTAAVQLLDAPPGLPESTRFAEDLALDSLLLVEWTMALEDVFDVELPEEDVTATATLGELVGLLVHLLDVDRALER